MNDSGIVNNMIQFIEEKEKQLQAAKLANENQGKTDIVKSILDQLEREIKNEDK